MRALRLLANICILMLVGCARTPHHSADYDRYRVEEAALRYLMDAQSAYGDERDHYSAYVIQQGQYTSQLLAAFDDYKPRVVADMQVSTMRGVAVDKATGKPVKLWSVRVIELEGDRATAGVSWSTGNVGAGRYTLHLLRRKVGRWMVDSEKMDWIS